ncbi:MAG: B12-binding domain-containing radical SAM protein, partial [Halieaceae bacterium]|nr:B12-binding domain-containing radical SAM protein [Halieaceae bacterium]
TYKARRAYQIATQFRQRGVPVLMGGYHPTFMLGEALQYADAVVVGDAEGVWEQVVRDAEKGKLGQIYRQTGYPSLQGVRPDRRIFRGKRYAPAALVQYGRGCRFACEFCSIHAFYGHNLRQRPVREVVAEIEALDRTHIFLVDDNIFVDIPKAKALFNALIPLNIRWSCQVSIDVTQDDALLNLMEQSGCTIAVVGFESLHEDNLTQMKKRWNLKHGDYLTAIQKLRDHGVMIYGTFVFGYDRDTVDSFDISLEFAIRAKFYLSNFNPLTPMPGARLYDRLQTEDRLIYDRWWLDPTYRYGQATFHPRGMTADELTEGCLTARKAFNRYGSILKRAVDFKANCRDPYRLGLHLASNIVSRREINRKQGQRLGAVDAEVRTKNEAVRKITLE